MKTAIVYYSLDGNTKYIANRIAKELDADIIPLILTKEYPTGKFSRYFWCGKSVTFGESPKLEAYQFDAKDYDLILLGTPIWAGTFTPPLRTFLKHAQLANKKVALFASCSGGPAEKCFSKIKKAIPTCSVLATLRLIDPRKAQCPADNDKIAAFCETLKAGIEE